MNNEHIWTPASTDITLRWRRLYGYIPASEQQETKEKWKAWRDLLSRDIPDRTEQTYQNILTKTRKKQNA